MSHIAGPVDEDFGIVGLEVVLQAIVLRGEVDPLADDRVPLRGRFAGKDLHAGVGQLGDVEHRPIARLCADGLVRRAGQARRTQGPEEVATIVHHDEPHEAVGHEAVGHHLLDALANRGLARRRIGGQALPALLGVDHEEAAREGAAVEVAPYRRDAGILVVVEHAVEVVQGRVEGRAVLVGVGVARVGQLADADDRNTPPELHVRQMAREVDHHAAARSARQAETDRDHRRKAGALDLIDELAQRHIHGAAARVVGIGIDALGDGAREMLAGLGHLVFFGHIGFEVRVPVVARIFELQELARPVHTLEEIFLRRHGQRDRLEQEPVGGNPAGLQPLDEGGGVVLRQVHVLVADVDHHGGEGRPRVGQVVFDLAGAEQGFDIGRAGAADTDDVHAMRSLDAGGAMVERRCHGCFSFL